ncbi:hypothetical protein CDL12_10073 [Handroanthus impetiginosus]|uniref:DUF4408 domain-containing protein n=1 Tax=Handroanthus impetiginosus TaxID=429701 RepID=A0A2G9HI93_9LAMI|nr:hypothetical protein CDL12_10073 [Handroanthus impetiginosus]
MNGVELMTSWFTPTVLFCILNLMIGTIFITSSLKPQQSQRNIGDNEDSHPPPQLARVPSFLERVKSFNLSRYLSEPNEPVHYAVPAQEQAAHQVESEQETEESHHVTRSKSDTAEKATPAARVLKKSASEKVAPTKKIEEEVDLRRPVTEREKTAPSREEDDAVDAKADDFINRFRQQLKLQRLDSILRYKEMLNRGTRS